MGIYQKFIDEQEEKRKKQQAQKQADELKYRKTYTAAEKKRSGYQTIDDLEAAYGDGRRPVTGNVSYASSTVDEVGMPQAQRLLRKQNEAEAAYKKQKQQDKINLQDQRDYYFQNRDKTPYVANKKPTQPEPVRVSQEEYDRTMAEEQILYPGRVTRPAQERINAINRAEESKVYDDANYEEELKAYLKKYPRSNERAFQMQRAYDSDKGANAGQKSLSRLQALKQKADTYLADPDSSKKLPQRIAEGAGAVAANVGASFVDFGRGQADSLLAATYGAQRAEQGATPFIGRTTAADREQAQRVITAFKQKGMELPANFYDQARGFNPEDVELIIQKVNSGDKKAAHQAIVEGWDKFDYNLQKNAIDNLIDPNFEGNASKDARQRLDASVGGVVQSIDAWADVANRSRFVQDIAGGSRSAARTLTYALPYVGTFVGGMDSYKQNLTEKVEQAKVEGKEPDYDSIQTYAIGATVIDAATERISNAVAGFKAGSAALKAVEKPTLGTVFSAAMRGMVNEAAEDMLVPTVGRFAGYLAKQSLGEGFEEVLSGIGTGLLAKATTDKDKALSDLITAEDLWSQFVGGAFMGLLFPIVGSTRNFIKSRQMIEHYSGQKISDIKPEDMQRVIDSIYKEGQSADAKIEIKESLAEATVNINKSGQQLVEQRTGQTFEVTNPTIDGTVAIQNVADGTTIAVTGEELQAAVQTGMFVPAQQTQAAPVAAAQAQAPTVNNSNLPMTNDTTGAASFPDAPTASPEAAVGVAELRTLNLPSGDREVAISRYTATNGKQAEVRAQMNNNDSVSIEVESKGLPISTRFTVNADDFAMAQQSGQNMRQFLMQEAAKSKTNLPVQAQKLAGEYAGTLFDAIEAATGKLISNRITTRTQTIEAQQQAQVATQVQAQEQAPIIAEKETIAAFKNKSMADLTGELEDSLFKTADLAQEFRHKQVEEGKFDKSVSDALDKTNADLKEMGVSAYYAVQLEKNITRQQKGIRSILEEATGKNVIYVYGVGVDAVNEFVTDVSNEHIMVNVNNSHVKIAWSIGHGAVHVLQELGLDSELNKAVENVLGMTKEEMIAAKIDEYAAIPEHQQSLTDNPEQAYREFIADRGGQIFNSVDFYERMFDGNTKRKSIVNRLIKWLNKAKESLSGIPAAISEIDAVVDALNKAKTETIAAPITETSGGVDITSKAVLGEVVESAIRPNVYIETQYAVVDAADLIASHDYAGNANIVYEQTLQPRDRDRADSKLKISSIVTNVDPRMLVGNETVKNGAPVVGSDGMVESGNGRVIAMQEFYRRDNASAKKYREYITENATKYGIDSANLPKNPALIRIRLTDIDNRASYTQEANVAEQAKMSSSEIAKIDATKMTSKLVSFIDTNESGDIRAASNRDFVKAFIAQVIPDQEQGNATQADGQLSADGEKRIRNALFFRAYNSSALVERVSESTNSKILTITNALMKLAPKVVFTQDMIQKENYYNLDFTKDLVKAVEVYTKLDQTKIEGYDPVESFKKQTSLVDHGLTPISLNLMKMIYQYRASGSKLTGFLNSLYNGIADLGNPRNLSLFGENNIPTIEAFIENTIEEDLKKNGINVETRQVESDDLPLQQHARRTEADQQAESEEQINPVGQESQSEGYVGEQGQLTIPETPIKMTEEEYLSRKGYSSSSYGEPGLHSPGGGKDLTRDIERTLEQDRAISKKRAELAAEYRQLVENGEIIPKTKQEILEETAQGHPDNEATQAARRRLEKLKAKSGMESDIDKMNKAAAATNKEYADKVFASGKATWSNYDIFLKRMGKEAFISKYPELAYMIGSSNSEAFAQAAIPPLEKLKAKNAETATTETQYVKGDRVYLKVKDNTTTGTVLSQQFKGNLVTVKLDTGIIQGVHPDNIVEKISESPKTGMNDVYKNTEAKAEAISEYEQKRLDRIERLHELADKSRNAASANIKSMDQILEVIPLGQPILTDHYSAKGHRADLNRAHNYMRKSVEASDKAEYYERRAAAAEKNKAISMDDPAAVERLTAKVAELEAEREAIKARNAELRKEGKAGSAPYVLQNLGANIRATKQRLEQAQKLESKRFQPQAENLVRRFDGVDLVENIEANRIQFQFDGKPPADTIATLKSQGFRWAPSEKAWQRQLNNNGKYAAKQVLKQLGLSDSGVQFSLDSDKLAVFNSLSAVNFQNDIAKVLEAGRKAKDSYMTPAVARDVLDIMLFAKSMGETLTVGEAVGVHQIYSDPDMFQDEVFENNKDRLEASIDTFRAELDYGEIDSVNVKDYGELQIKSLEVKQITDGKVQYSLDAQELLEKKPPEGMEAHKGNRALQLFKQETINEITDAHMYYRVQPNAHTIELAARALATDRRAAELRAMNTNDISPVSQALRIVLMRDADMRGASKEAADFFMAFNKSNLKAGQAIQYNTMLTKLSAETITNIAVKNILKPIKNDKQKSIDDTVADVAGDLHEFDAKAAEEVEVLNDFDSMKKAVAEVVVKPDTLDTVAMKKLWDRTIKRLEETLHTLEDDADPVWEFTLTLHETAAQLMPAIELPKTSDPAVFMRYVQNNMDKMGDSMRAAYDIIKALHGDDAVFMGEIDSYFGAFIPEFVPSGEHTQLQITPELFDDIKQTVTDHYAEDYHTFNRMVRRLMELDINPDDAVSLARIIRDEINKLTREEKLRAVQKVMPAGRDSTPWMMKLINMSNEGKLTDADLQAFISKASGFPGATPDAINYIRKLAQEIETINTLASMQGRRLTSDEQRRISVLQGYVNKRIADELNSATVGSKIDYVDSMFLMSRPKTGIRNIVGNTGFGLVDTFIIDPIAAAIDKHIVSKFTGVQTVSSPQLKALRDGLKRGISESYYDITHEIYTSSISTQWDVPRATVLTSKVGRMANMLFRLAMELPDRAYQVAYYESSLAGQMKLANVKQPTVEMEEVALYDAMRKTFSDDSRLAKTFSKLKRTMNLQKGFGLGSLVVKFPRTPANLVMRSIEYSPVGFFSALYDLAKPMHEAKKNKHLGVKFEDNFNQKRFVQSLTRGTVGSALTIGVGALLTSMGLMVGRLPDDDEERAALAEAGIGRNYMVNWTGLWRYVTSGLNPVATLKQDGDMWGTYSWFSPMNIGIGIGANLVEDMKDVSAADADKLDAVWSAAVGSLTSGIASVSEMSLMSGVNKFLNRLTYSQNDPLKAAYDTFLELPSRLVPGVVTGFKEMIDNTYRTTGRPNDGLIYAYNLMKNKLPGASFTLPPQVNEFGNLEEVYQNNGNNVWNVFFNPSNIYHWTPNEATQMVLAVMAEADESGISRSNILPADSYNFAKELKYKEIGDPVSLTYEERAMLTEQINKKVTESWKEIPASLTVEEKVKKMQNSHNSIAQSIKKAYQAKKLAELKKQKLAEARANRDAAK